MIAEVWRRCVSSGMVRVCQKESLHGQVADSEENRIIG